MPLEAKGGIADLGPLKIAQRSTLTRREREISDGIFRGLSNKDIAGELNLSERTVKFHVSNLLIKYRVNNRFKVAHAVRTGIEPGTLPDTLA